MFTCTAKAHPRKKRPSPPTSQINSRSTSLRLNRAISLETGILPFPAVFFNSFLQQMLHRYPGMPEQHTRTGKTHHLPHTFPHFRLIAMHGTTLTRRLPFTERTPFQPVTRILHQCAAIRTQTIISFLMPAIQTDHYLHNPLFFIYPGNFHTQTVFNT